MEQTFGMKVVEYSFNPSNLDEVSTCKKQFADVIDQLYKLKVSTESDMQDYFYDAAIEKVIDAQMWAVKAITWKD